MFSLFPRATFIDFNVIYKTKMVNDTDPVQGPVVQSVVSLTSSFVVKMLTVLLSAISYSQEVLLKKCE